MSTGSMSMISRTVEAGSRWVSQAESSRRRSLQGGLGQDLASEVMDDRDICLVAYGSGKYFEKQGKHLVGNIVSVELLLTASFQ